jgi:hypothetical protein
LATLTCLALLVTVAVIAVNHARAGSSARQPLLRHGSSTGSAGNATGSAGNTPGSAENAPAAAAEGGLAFQRIGGGDSLGTPRKPASGGSPAGISSSVLFGGDMPLAHVELGRTLGIIRAYYRLGDRFPRTMDSRLMSEGTTELVSLDTVPGGPTYASIASGRQDSVILPFLRAMDRAAVTYRLRAIYFTFEHEADDPYHHAGLGTPAQFVHAWDHVHQLAASAQLNWNQGGRLHWVLILRHVAYQQGGGLAEAYWPGTNKVDVVAADGYQTNGCRGPGNAQGPGRVTPASLFDSLLGFAAHVGLPVFIAEWGSVSYPSPAVRPAFIRAMQAYISANHQIMAAMYWDSHTAVCDYGINNSPKSLAALAAMGQAPSMQAFATAG